MAKSKKIIERADGVKQKYTVGTDRVPDPAGLATFLTPKLKPEAPVNIWALVDRASDSATSDAELAELASSEHERFREAAVNAQAARQSKEEPVTEYDIDELNDSLGQKSRFDEVAYVNVRNRGDQGDGEYVEESIEVIEEDGKRVVVLKRESTRFIFDSFVYPDNEGGDEADTLAADAFNAGNREVDAAAAETAQAAVLKTAEEEMAHIALMSSEDSDFDDLRRSLEDNAERDDIDLDGIEVREERVVEFSDSTTTDLVEHAKAKLDTLWEAADAENE